MRCGEAILQVFRVVQEINRRDIYDRDVEVEELEAVRLREQRDALIHEVENLAVAEVLEVRERRQLRAKRRDESRGNDEARSLGVGEKDRIIEAHARLRRDGQSHSSRDVEAAHRHVADAACGEIYDVADAAVGDLVEQLADAKARVALGILQLCFGFEGEAANGAIEPDADEPNVPEQSQILHCDLRFASELCVFDEELPAA